ncbi:MAG: hypothetical protein V4467_03965 [Patescibacteria group bacterium]
MRTSAITHGVRIARLLESGQLRTQDLAKFAEKAEAAFYPDDEVGRTVSIAFTIALAAVDDRGPKLGQLEASVSKEVWNNEAKCGSLITKLEDAVKARNVLGQEQLARVCGLKAELGIEFSVHPRIEFPDALALASALVARAPHAKNDYVHMMEAQGALARAYRELPGSLLTMEAWLLNIEARLRRGKDEWDFAGLGADSMPKYCPLRPWAFNSLFRVTQLPADFSAARSAAELFLDLDHEKEANRPLINAGLHALIALAEIADYSGQKDLQPEIKAINQEVLGWVDAAPEQLCLADRIEVLVRLFGATRDPKYAVRCSNLMASTTTGVPNVIESYIRLFGFGYTDLKADYLLRQVKVYGDEGIVGRRRKASLLLLAIENSVVNKVDAPKVWREAYAFAEQELGDAEKFELFCRLARVAKTMAEVPVFPPKS